jgi:hypothetical protein
MKMPKLPPKDRADIMVGVACIGRLIGFVPGSCSRMPMNYMIAMANGWCLVRGRGRDAKARSEYVAEKLRLKHEGDGT